jgi:integrase
MATALTKLGIDAAISGIEKGQRVELIDDREHGLRIRIGERGAKWSLLSRTTLGQLIRVPLGVWPSMGVADARKAARDAKRDLDRGINPNEQKRQAIIAAKIAAMKSRPLSEILDQYQQERLDKLRRGSDARRALDGSKGLLRPMLTREPASIMKSELVEAVRKHAKTSPIAANRALAYASAFFNWCVSEDIISANPISKVKKPAKEVSRDRHHTMDELAEIWQAAGTLGYPFGHIYRLLIVLPMRREELTGLLVAELDLCADEDCIDAVWTLPGKRTKNGQALRVPLAPLARSIIKDALDSAARPGSWKDEKGRQHVNPFVFSTTGNTPVSGFGRAKRRLDAAVLKIRAKTAAKSKIDLSPMPHWTIHDLRTSFTTISCQYLKTPANVADRCLNHVATATTSKISRIYNQNDLYEERKMALTSWSRLIHKISCDV